MKISELTENDVIHIRNKKEAKHVWRLLRKEGFSWHDLGTNTWKTFKECYKQCFNAMCINYFDRCYSDISTYKGRNIIPASKFLKQSISKKDLQEALSKVGEQLSYMNERLGKLEDKSEPKTANGIEIHFDEVKEEVKESVGLGVGKWYTLREDSNVIACYLGEHRAYGLNGNGIWSTDIRMSQIDYWEPATESEVFEALKAEACKQYKVGQTVFDNWSNCKITLNDLTRFDYSNGNLFVLNMNNSKTHLLGSNGQWATIIPQPEAIDFSKAGQLVEVIATGQKWITSGTHTDDVFDGTLIVGSAEYVGQMRKGVLKKYITLCTEPVTLSN